MLALLTAALPANLAVTTFALARRTVTRPPAPAPAPGRHTVLITGGKMTKALQLSRSFWTAGHRVVLVETAKYRLTGHRFSRAVSAFHVVPPTTDPRYPSALLEIVRAEGVDVLVPVSSPLASRYDAEAAELLRPYCEVVHADADLVRLLDDKYAFAACAASLGLPVPDTHRMTSPADVSAFCFDTHPGPYVLKSLAYDPVNRLDLTPLPRRTEAATEAFAATKPITSEAPWILQSFVRGREYCTHSTVRDGEIVAHVCCESSAFQLNYAAVDKPGIEAWVRTFVAATRITGQVSFDFIEDHDGTALAIECNPRTHSAITTFHDQPDLPAAYLGDLPAEAAPVRPRPGSRPTYWIYQESWRLLTRPRSARERLRIVRGGKDAIFDWTDPLPFLLVHHLQIPSLLLRNLMLGKEWTRIDVNIGKLVEPGGD
jgi:predicted ATP-grasp superfamily ATP-dependent carboligase